MKRKMIIMEDKQGNNVSISLMELAIITIKIITKIIIGITNLNMKNRKTNNNKDKTAITTTTMI